jgi:hypothetical protein
LEDLRLNEPRKYYFQHLFILKIYLTPRKLINTYIKKLKAWYKADPKGETKTNSGFGWHSKTNMNELKQFEPLTKELFMMAEACNLDYGVQPKLGLR